MTSMEVHLRAGDSLQVIAERPPVVVRTRFLNSDPRRVVHRSFRARGAAERFVGVLRRNGNALIIGDLEAVDLDERLIRDAANGRLVRKNVREMGFRELTEGVPPLEPHSLARRMVDNFTKMIFDAAAFSRRAN